MNPTREQALLAMAVAEQIAGRPHLHTANAMATARRASASRHSSQPANGPCSPSGARPARTAQGVLSRAV